VRATKLTWDVDHGCSQATLGQLPAVVDGALQGGASADMDGGGLQAAAPDAPDVASSPP
jgi:hypothetical protein